MPRWYKNFGTWVVIGTIFNQCPPVNYHHRHTPLRMDFSNFNSAEQAHMTKIIEKKQACKHILSLQCIADTCVTDARLFKNVLQPCWKVLQLMLQRLHKQGPINERGFLKLPIPLLTRCWPLVSSPGPLRNELHRKIHQTLGEDWCAIRRIERWCVYFDLTSYEQLLTNRSSRCHECSAEPVMSLVTWRHTLIHTPTTSRHRTLQRCLIYITAAPFFSLSPEPAAHEICDWVFRWFWDTTEYPLHEAQKLASLGRFRLGRAYNALLFFPEAACSECLPLWDC